MGLRESGKKGILLGIEGVDLVGKTTLAWRLAEIPGWKYFSTPGQLFGAIRNEVEALRDLQARFFYYLASVVVVQAELRGLLSSGYNVAVDRYIDSTFIMHEVMGVDVECVSRTALPILSPDLTVILHADEETRVQRRLRRDHQLSHDLVIEQSLEIGERAQKVFLHLGHPAIDTTANNETEVLTWTLQTLQEAPHGYSP
jgi:thymidylate kinase